MQVTDIIELKQITLPPERSIGSNIIFKLIVPGFAGIFRIYYRDVTTKKDKYRIYRAESSYLECNKEYFDKEDMQFTSSSFETCNVVDAVLFVERKKQWLLEELQRRS